MGFFKKSTEEQTDDAVDVEGWLQSADEPSKVPMKRDDDMVDLNSVMADFTPPPPPPAPTGPFAFDPNDEGDAPQRRAEDSEAASTGPGSAGPGSAGTDWADPDWADDDPTDETGSDTADLATRNAGPLGVSEAPMWHFPEIDDETDTELYEAPAEVEASIEPQTEERFDPAELVQEYDDVPALDDEAEDESYEDSVAFQNSDASEDSDTSRDSDASQDFEATEDDEVQHVNPSVFTTDEGELCVAESEQADVLLEILGVDRGATWDEIRAARAALLANHDPQDEDEARAELARAIRREMNTAYAALRLIAVP